MPSRPIVPIFRHAHLAGEPENIDEQLLDVFQEPSPKRSDRVVVGMIVGRDEPKRHRIVCRPLQLAAGEHARRVTINQQPQQHPRMIRSRTRAAIGPAHPTKVESVDHFDDEPRQVPLRKPLVNRRRKQITRLPVDAAEIVHAAQFVAKRESVSRFYSAKTEAVPLKRVPEIKSDRLLASGNVSSRPKAAVRPSWAMSKLRASAQSLC